MQIGSRFTEYGLTGGFFWICQLILLLYSGRTQLLLSNLSTVQLQIPTEISQIGSTAITSLVGALAIITVFVAGLLLDLVAVYFRPMEMSFFGRHIIRNREWLARLVAAHKGYCESDYEAFEQRYGNSSLAKDMLAGFDIFFLWNRERRQRYVETLKRNSGWGLARPYERLWSFLASYVVVQSGSSQLSLMVDQYYLWRAGRAVSAALLIVFFEVQFLIVATEFFQSTTRAPEISIFVTTIFPLGISLLAMAITLGTYSRLCFTLFALVYVTQDKRN